MKHVFVAVLLRLWPNLFPPQSCFWPAFFTPTLRGVCYTGIAHLHEERNGYKDRENEHSSESVKVQRPPPTPIHQGDRYQGHNDHDGADTNGGVLSVRLRQTCRHKQVGGVVKDLKRTQKWVSSFYSNVLGFLPRWSRTVVVKVAWRWQSRVGGEVLEIGWAPAWWFWPRLAALALRHAFLRCRLRCRSSFVVFSRLFFIRKKKELKIELQKKIAETALNLEINTKYKLIVANITHPLGRLILVVA